MCPCWSGKCHAPNKALNDHLPYWEWCGYVVDHCKIMTQLQASDSSRHNLDHDANSRCDHTLNFLLVILQVVFGQFLVDKTCFLSTIRWWFIRRSEHLRIFSKLIHQMFHFRRVFTFCRCSVVQWDFVQFPFDEFWLSKPTPPVLLHGQAMDQTDAGRWVRGIIHYLWFLDSTDSVLASLSTMTWWITSWQVTLKWEA